MCVWVGGCMYINLTTIDMACEWVFVLIGLLCLWLLGVCESNIQSKDNRLISAG